MAARIPLEWLSWFSGSIKLRSARLQVFRVVSPGDSSSRLAVVSLNVPSMRPSKLFEPWRTISPVSPVVATRWGWYPEDLQDMVVAHTVHSALQPHALFISPSFESRRGRCQTCSPDEYRSNGACI